MTAATMCPAPTQPRRRPLRPARHRVATPRRRPVRDGTRCRKRFTGRRPAPGRSPRLLLLLLLLLLLPPRISRPLHRRLPQPLDPWAMWRSCAAPGRMSCKHCPKSSAAPGRSSSPTRRLPRSTAISLPLPSPPPGLRAPSAGRTTQRICGRPSTRPWASTARSLHLPAAALRRALTQTQKRPPPGRPRQRRLTSPGDWPLHRRRHPTAQRRSRKRQAAPVRWPRRAICRVTLTNYIHII